MNLLILTDLFYTHLSVDIDHVPRVLELPDVIVAE